MPWFVQKRTASRMLCERGLDAGGRQVCGCGSCELLHPVSVRGATRFATHGAEYRKLLRVIDASASLRFTGNPGEACVWVGGWVGVWVCVCVGVCVCGCVCVGVWVWVCGCVGVCGW